MEKTKERFFKKIRQTESCWLWIGIFHRSGYGKFKVRRNTYAYAHRVAWELLRGPIPEGLTIDHLCFVKACVNPAHLEPCTIEENNRRYLATRPPKVPKPVKLCSPCPHGELRRWGCALCRRIYNREEYLRRTEGKVKRRYKSHRKSACEQAGKQAGDEAASPGRDSL